MTGAFVLFFDFESAIQFSLFTQPILIEVIFVDKTKITV